MYTKAYGYIAVRLVRLRETQAIPRTVENMKGNTSKTMTDDATRWPLFFNLCLSLGRNSKLDLYPRELANTRDDADQSGCE